jgi:hypothetical protein
MSDLHPSARSFIDSAKRREAPLPEEVRGRVHRSVLRRVAAVAAAVTTTTSTSVAAKAGALVGVFASPLVATATLSGLVGAGFLVVSAVSKPSAPPRLPPLATATHEVAHPVPAPAATLVPLPPEPAMSAATPNESLEVPARPARLPTPAMALAPAKTPDRQDRDTPEATELPPPVNASGPAALAEPPRPRPMSDDLVVELDLLREVHSALRARQADRALALLDRYDRGGRTGPLDEEAQAARVSALCQLGRQTDARAALARFAARWPGSVLTTQLESSCFTRGGAGGE